jgi:hypothetical protein
MIVEAGNKIAGEPYTDFLVNDGMGDTGFAARLEGNTLSVDWTGQPGTTFTRLANVQELVGGLGSIETITGYATDNLAARGVAPEVVARGLRQSLGGNWNVTIVQQGVKQVITATRIATGG